ncbi:MAG: phosphoribosylformylglycinamidine synthase, partial [Woeseiales bacterium]
MSIRVSDVPLAEVKTILELPGQSALSNFRLQKLLRDLQEVNALVENVAARFTYFVSFSNSSNSDDRVRLDALLLSETASLSFEPDATLIQIAPRPGTISPWSSKATDIVHACNLRSVERVERGVCYALTISGALTAAESSLLSDVLFDRMTEIRFSSSKDAESLFQTHEPALLTVVPLMAEGVVALERANVELGLALSVDEIEYLERNYADIGRDPTDAELMMFAQANSEHCRHKIFNADWIIDGEPQSEQLFGMIRSTTAASPAGVVSAYSDNSAVMEGWQGQRLMPTTEDRSFTYVNEPIQILMKVETHNHPTAISPFPGAATGSGGEIRDEGATGLGARPKAGLTGFTVSHLRIPDLKQPWEIDFPHPER